MKSVPIRSFFRSVFFRIWTEYGDLRSRSPFSVRIRGNTDRKKVRICTLFTYCLVLVFLSSGRLSIFAFIPNTQKHWAQFTQTFLKYMGQSIQEWTKYNLWKTTFKKFYLSIIEYFVPYLRKLHKIFLRYFYVLWVEI